MNIQGKEIVAMEGKYIARKGTENYFRRCTLLPNETEADFVEVDNIPDAPSHSEAEYKEQVIARIRERYTIDDEIAIIRQKESKPQEWNEYNQYVESCKAEVKTKLTII